MLTHSGATPVVATKLALGRSAAVSKKLRSLLNSLTGLESRHGRLLYLQTRRDVLAYYLTRVKRGYLRSQQVLERFNVKDLDLAERENVLKVRKYALSQASALDAEFKEMLEEIKEGLEP